MRGVLLGNTTMAFCAISGLFGAVPTRCDVLAILGVHLFRHLRFGHMVSKSLLVPQSKKMIKSSILNAMKSLPYDEAIVLHKILRHILIHFFFLS